MAENKILVPLTIPVKSMVKGYLIYTLGKDLLVRQSTLPGILINAFLHKDGHDNIYNHHKISYEYEVTLLVEAWQVERYGYTMSTTQIKRFNTAITYQVYELLFCRLDALGKYGFKKGIMKKEILNFMTEYNLLEYGMSYENCKKQYQRHREDRKNKHRALQILLPF
jgi:hypothetical protein